MAATGGAGTRNDMPTGVQSTPDYEELFQHYLNLIEPVCTTIDSKQSSNILLFIIDEVKKYINTVGKGVLEKLPPPLNVTNIDFQNNVLNKMVPFIKNTIANTKYTEKQKCFELNKRKNTLINYLTTFITDLKVITDDNMNVVPVNIQVSKVNLNEYKGEIGRLIGIDDTFGGEPIIKTDKSSLDFNETKENIKNKIETLKEFLKGNSSQTEFNRRLGEIYGEVDTTSSISTLIPIATKFYDLLREMKQYETNIILRTTFAGPSPKTVGGRRRARTHRGRRAKKLTRRGRRHTRR